MFCSVLFPLSWAFVLSGLLSTTERKIEMHILLLVFDTGCLTYVFIRWCLPLHVPYVRASNGPTVTRLNHIMCI